MSTAEQHGAGYLDEHAVAQTKLVTPMDLSERITRLHENGMPRGCSTGWPAVDRHYTVAPGYVTLITGWPGSGKSEWLDALALNLILSAGWQFCFYSPENQPYELHLAKFTEKLLCKPFAAGPSRRIDTGELAGAVGALETALTWITPTAGGDGLAIGDILGTADRRLAAQKPRIVNSGLVIDPWNEIAHFRPERMSETEYISASLGAIRRWSRDNQIHTWIVAHPQKLRRDDSGKLPIPRPDSISGSQHWWNKADACLTIWRELGADTSSPLVQIHVQKMRFKHHGIPGVVELEYDRITGTYADPAAKIVNIHGRKAKSKPVAEDGMVEL
jgi:twinkle protein